MLLCGTCGLFKAPLRVLEYPIGTNVPDTVRERPTFDWVQCGAGGTVNNMSTGCGVHTQQPRDDAPPRRALVHTPDDKPKPKRALVHDAAPKGRRLIT